MFSVYYCQEHPAQTQFSKTCWPTTARMVCFEDLSFLWCKVKVKVFHKLCRSTSGISFGIKNQTIWNNYFALYFLSCAILKCFTQYFKTIFQSYINITWCFIMFCMKLSVETYSLACSELKINLCVSIDAKYDVANYGFKLSCPFK